MFVICILLEVDPVAPLQSFQLVCGRPSAGRQDDTIVAADAHAFDGMQGRRLLAGRKRFVEVIARAGDCSVVVRAGSRAKGRAWLLSMLSMHAQGLEGLGAPREAAVSCLEPRERGLERVKAVVDERDDAAFEQLELACDCGEVMRLIAAGGRADGRVDLA